MILQKSFLTTFEKALFLGFIFTFLFSLLNFSNDCQNVSQKIFRLHVIANSDSKEDQIFKLEIKNMIIKCFRKYDNFGIKNLSDAKRKINKNLKIIKEEIFKNNINNNTKINFKVCKSHFGNRTYNGFILPAGTYDSLLVTIGEGKGKNWWCIVFPPMCLPAAEEKDIQSDKNESISLFDDILSKKEINVIENSVKYEIRFKIIDYFEYIRYKIHSIVLKAYEYFHDNSSKNEQSDKIKKQ